MGALISIAFALKYLKIVIKLIALNAVFKRSASKRQVILKRAHKVLQTRQTADIESMLKRWFFNKKKQCRAAKIAFIRNLLSALNMDGYGATYKLFGGR